MVSMCLCLKEAYARVELDRDVEVLVLERHDAHKSGLVRTDLGDVAVAAGTELWMAITAVLRLGWWTMERLVDLCGEGDN